MPKRVPVAPVAPLEGDPSSSNKLEKLRTTSLIVMVGWTMAIIIHYALLVYFRKPLYPYATYLFSPGDALHDFVGQWEMNQGNDPFHTVVRGFGNNYPPFGYGIMLPFSILPLLVGLVLYILFLISGFFGMFWHHYRIRGDKSGWMPFVLVPLFLMTYPFHFCIDRGNSEGFIVLAAWMFATLHEQGRDRFAPLFLGIAAAAKAYPGMYALVYLAQWRWRKFFECIGWTIFFTAFAMTVFSVTPNEVRDAYARSFETFRIFSLTPSNAQHGVSMLGAYKYLETLVDGAARAFDPVHAQRTIVSYFYVAFPVLAVLAASALAPGLVLWERLTLIVAGILLAPQTSFDYKLAHLFLPFAAFLKAPTDKRTSRYYATLFGLLFVPKHYFILVEDVSASVLINPLLVMALAVPLVRKAYRSWRDFSRLRFSGKVAAQ